MKIYLIIFFATMCIVQWAVPAKMIADQEILLTSGKVFKFKTAPIDPNDPFRGSYITLRYEIDTFEPVRKIWDQGDRIFVLLKQDSASFTTVKELSRQRPTLDIDYVEATIQYVNSDGTVTLEFPFERFYLEESKAPKAERVYWETNRNDSTHVAYALVRIKNGKAALEDVMINDRSIVEIVKELNTKKNN